jgi:hypothetical protein
MSKIEDLKAKKAQIEKRISQLQIQHSVAERKAETHVKAALGGAVLVVLNDPKVSLTFKMHLLDVADTGVQKSGLGREKFEELKTHHAPSVTKIAA